MEEPVEDQLDDLDDRDRDEVASEDDDDVLEYEDDEVTLEDLDLERLFRCLDLCCSYSICGGGE